MKLRILELVLKPNSLAHMSIKPFLDFGDGSGYESAISGLNHKFNKPGQIRRELYQILDSIVPDSKCMRDQYTFIDRITRLYVNFVNSDTAEPECVERIIWCILDVKIGRAHV